VKSVAYFFPLLFLAILSCTPKSGAKMTATTATAPKPTTSPYLGTWNYAVPGTPMGDVTGKLILKLENGLIKGHIESDGTVSIIEDLKLEDRSLTGNIFYSGTLVKMEGIFDGDKYSGNLIADGAGTFKIMASRADK